MYSTIIGYGHDERSFATPRDGTWIVGLAPPTSRPIIVLLYPTARVFTPHSPWPSITIEQPVPTLNANTLFSGAPLQATTTVKRSFATSKIAIGTAPQDSP